MIEKLIQVFGWQKEGCSNFSGLDSQGCGGLSKREKRRGGRGVYKSGVCSQSVAWFVNKRKEAASKEV